MTKFDQFLKTFLKESPPAPTPGTIDLTKLTPEQLQELVAAANDPSKALQNNHPLFQKPKTVPTTTPQVSANNVNPAPNAANKQTI